VLKMARGVGGLVLATVFTCLGMNVLGSDQYLAIVIPGRMYRDAYEMAGLKPTNLSRALEDSGTLTSVLIPWNTCGAFMIATLSLSPWTYVPYCFLNLLNPIISVFYGFTGLTMHKLDARETEVTDEA
jgi:Na+:H+ antiporter, NhaC family